MLEILLILIFIRAFISPLSYPFVDTLCNYFLIAASLILIIPHLKRGKPCPGQGFFILFFFSIIVSVFISVDPIKSLSTLPRFLSYFFIFYAVYYTAGERKDRIASSLILIAGAISLYATYWFYIGSLSFLEYIKEQQIKVPFALELVSRKRAFMPYVLPSMLAGYLAMMLPFSIGYVLENKYRLGSLTLRNISLFLSILLTAFTLLLTKSVGAFLSLFLAFLVFIYLSKMFNKKVLLILLGLFFLCTTIFVMRSYSPEYYNSPAFSIHKRLTYWQNTVSVIAQHPIKGTGLGNFPFIQSKYAHNSYLQIWAEIGLLGIIAFLGFIYKVRTSLLLNKLTADKLYAGTIIAYLCFLIHNLFDFTFFLPEVCTFWWIILALFLNVSEKHKNH